MTISQANPTLIIERMRKAIEDETWIPCPSCPGEWTKLRPCAYYWFDAHGRHDAVTHLCVDCAEGVRGLMFCSRTWPITTAPEPLKIDVFWPQDKQPNWFDVDAINPGTGNHYLERVMRWNRLIGRVRRWNFGTQGEPLFDALVKTGTNACQIAVHVKALKDPIYLENIVAAWHWIKAKIERGLNEHPEESEQDFQRVR